VLYHPKAILGLLERVLKRDYFTHNELFEYRGLWHCFDVHSQLSRSSAEALLEELNTLCENVYYELSTATHLILTYGTAWYYSYKVTQQFVANCHKLPHMNFDKSLSNIQELTEVFNRTLSLLRGCFPNLKIITTISPVRHIRDGIIENNRSKSVLITALSEVISNHKEVDYYPSYELVIDCLRDYRFYKKDLVHPNSIAIDYVWKHFQETYLYEKSTREVMKQVSEIQRGLAHKAFNPESEAHLKFLKKLSDKQEKLLKDFPFMIFNKNG